MTTKENIKGLDCWVSVKPLIVYDHGQVVDTGKYIASFSFDRSAPTEQDEIKDKEGRAARFDTRDEALDIAKKIAEASIRFR